MKRRLQRHGPILVLLTILIAITSVATYLQLRQEAIHPALSTMSSEPDGARALLLWLEALDYTVSTTVGSDFTLPQEAGLGLVLEPQLPGITPEEWQTLEQWVESGGHLFLIGEGFGAALSMQRFGFDIVYRDALEGEIEFVDERFFPVAPAAPVNLQPRAVLQGDQTEFSPVIAIGGEPLAVAISRGEGAIVLSTLIYPFTNRGLKAPGNGDFVWRLLAQRDKGAAIWIDEWHHGSRSSAAGSTMGLSHWIRTSRPGQAILYTAAVIFLWLLVTGRRFGAPIPLHESMPRRESAEHVTALAGLSRRAGHQQAVRDHFRRELKSRLGYRYGLASTLPDDIFLRQLAAVRPDLDEQRLRELFVSLNQENTHEEQLLKLAQETSEWIKR